MTSSQNDYAILDLEVGQWVAIYLNGLPGQVIQGKLANIIADDYDEPMIVQVEQDGKPWKLNVPWGNIIMIVRTDEPVDVPAPDLTQLEDFAKEMGLDIPVPVQDYLDGQSS